jgi:ubiquinone/menaquinone biosynthesis C-methylase UbiE
MERTTKGQELYVSAMEKSAEDKMRVFPFVRKKIIVDMGAGSGPITALLLQKFPQSKIVAVDNSSDMVSRLKKRFKDNSQVEVIKANAQTFSYSQPIDTILFISVMHEIFSFNHYSHEEVIEALKKAHKLLKKEGRLIIRDGVQPEQETLYLKPKHKEAYRRFNQFIESFKVRPLVFSEGTFHRDSFLQHHPRDYQEFKKGNYLIEMHSQDVSELLSKYFYPQVNWKIELSEQFGIWTLREYQHILIEMGYYIVYAETYVLSYLLKTHYNQDFAVFKLENGTLVKAQYPPSTMILVAEKT